jgi:hypothetical protein
VGTTVDDVVVVGVGGVGAPVVGVVVVEVSVVGVGTDVVGVAVVEVSVVGVGVVGAPVAGVSVVASVVAVDTVVLVGPAAVSGRVVEIAWVVGVSPGTVGAIKPCSGSIVVSVDSSSESVVAASGDEVTVGPNADSSPGSVPSTFCSGGSPTG